MQDIYSIPIKIETDACGWVTASAAGPTGRVRAVASTERSAIYRCQRLLNVAYNHELRFPGDPNRETTALGQKLKEIL